MDGDADAVDRDVQSLANGGQLLFQTRLFLLQQVQLLDKEVNHLIGRKRNRLPGRVNKQLS